MNRMTNMISILLAACLSACSNNSETVVDDMTEPYPTGKPTSGKAVVFTTTSDGAYSLYEEIADVVSGQSLSPLTIQLDPSQTHQSIDGFGYGITYSSCYNLLKMTPEDRNDLLTRTFSTTSGYGVSYCRISIGCNDFSSTEYSLCDVEGLEHFALFNDEVNYVIPILKEILAINPDLKIIGSPWTPPKWMKVDNLTNMRPYDSWTDGHLSPLHYDTYAEYFVKFIQAFQSEGIRIHAVTPQNEPLNHANCASCYMPWAEEAQLVKSMARAFKRAGLQTQIYVFDHNYNYDNVGDQDDYPVKIYNTLGEDYEGSELVAGAAYHDYGGTSDELVDIYTKAPQKALIFSESSIGTWNDGRNLATRLMADMKNVALGTVNRMCKAVIVWNFMLDTNMGPNLDGGCQTCFGAIDIDPSNYRTYTRNSHYYIIAHMSVAAATGAVRLGTSRNIASQNIISACFLNPDGTYGAVILNTGDEDKTINVGDGSSYVRVNVPAGGVSSVKWNR